VCGPAALEKLTKGIPIMDEKKENPSTDSSYFRPDLCGLQNKGKTVSNRGFQFSEAS